MNSNALEVQVCGQRTSIPEGIDAKLSSDAIKKHKCLDYQLILFDNVLDNDLSKRLIGQ